MTVLWLASWYPSRVLPTSGDFVARMAAATAARTRIVVLHAVADGGVVDRELAYTAGPFPVLRVYYPPASNRVAQVLALFAAYTAGLRHLRQLGHRFDLLHLHCLRPAAPVARWWAFRHGWPLLITEHWTGWRRNTTRPASWAERQMFFPALRHARRFLPVNAVQAEELRTRGIRTPSTVVPNVVDTALFSLRFTPPEKSFRFVHISSLNEAAKRVRPLLRAFAEVRRERPGVELLIVGDGADGPALRAYADRADLTDGVTFCGEVEHDRVPAVLHRSHALVLSSRIENLPCVLLEALATGTPVLTTETGGLHRWVGEAQGLVVPVADPTALVRGMHHLIDHYAVYTPEGIADRVREQCSYPAVGHRLRALYEQTLGEAGKARRRAGN